MGLIPNYSASLLEWVACFPAHIARIHTKIQDGCHSFFWLNLSVPLLRNCWTDSDETWFILILQWCTFAPDIYHWPWPTCQGHGLVTHCFIIFHHNIKTYQQILMGLIPNYSASLLEWVACFPAHIARIHTKIQDGCHSFFWLNLSVPLLRNCWTDSDETWFILILQWCTFAPDIYHWPWPTCQGHSLVTHCFIIFHHNIKTYQWILMGLLALCTLCPDLHFIRNVIAVRLELKGQIGRWSKVDNLWWVISWEPFVLDSWNLAPGFRSPSPRNLLILGDLEQLGQGQTFVGDISRTVWCTIFRFGTGASLQSPWNPLILGHLQQMGQGQTFVDKKCLMYNILIWHREPVYTGMLPCTYRACAQKSNMAAIDFNRFQMLHTSLWMKGPTQVWIWHHFDKIQDGCQSEELGSCEISTKNMFPHIFNTSFFSINFKWYMLCYW